jgi:hypothetical protein
MLSSGSGDTGFGSGLVEAGMSATFFSSFAL